MGKYEIKTKLAPPAIGPYSQGVKIGNLIFASGQIPLDPEAGEVVSGGIAEQTERVLENLRAVLEASGAGVGSVVKTTVYLTDLELFAEMNAVYAKFFTQPFPARATVGVATLPKGVLVEIDAVAVL